MNLEKFKAKNIDENKKQQCVKLIENGMENCPNCRTNTTDQTQKMCIKHKKMYGKLYP